MLSHGLSVHFRRNHNRLAPLYAIYLLLTLSQMLTAFVNAAFLHSYLSIEQVSIVYLIGSSLGLLTFLFISRVLHAVGNLKLMLICILLNVLALSIMAMLLVPSIAVISFLFFFISFPLLLYGTDVFVEVELDNKESSTGSRRGIMLTLGALVGAAAPFISGNVITESGSFFWVYLLAAIALMPILAILLINFRDFIDPPYKEIDVLGAIRSFWIEKNIRNVFLASLLFRIYQAFIVIYLPLYLVDELGLSWDNFGTLIAVALLAYLVFNYPTGYVSDHVLGERKLMITGFALLGITITLTGTITTSSLIVWMILLFIMRIGASLVLVTTESYFFKKTKSSDAQVISFFRTTSPIAYMLTAIIASIALLFIPLNQLFYVMGVVVLLALFFAHSLTDTN